MPMQPRPWAETSRGASLPSVRLSMSYGYPWPLGLNLVSQQESARWNERSVGTPPSNVDTSTAFGFVVESSTAIRPDVSPVRSARSTHLLAWRSNTTVYSPGLLRLTEVTPFPRTTFALAPSIKAASESPAAVGT